MTDSALPGETITIKQRAVIEVHHLTPAGLRWLSRNGYGPGESKQTRPLIDSLVSRGLAEIVYREINHNLVLNNGLTYIRDCIRNVQGDVAVPANVVNGMALGTSASEAVGTQTGLLAEIADSYNPFQVDPPAAGAAANEIDWVCFWGAGDPAGGPHNIQEVAIVPSQALAATQGINRISSGISIMKQDQATLTITLNWQVGTLA